MVEAYLNLLKSLCWILAPAEKSVQGAPRPVTSRWIGQRERIYLPAGHPPDEFSVPLMMGGEPAGFPAGFPGGATMLPAVLG